jgi:hypothetical protein
MRASNPSGLHLVPGFGARVIDANPQVWETALQRDGAGFGAFSGIEFGFNSPIDLKSESSVDGSWLERGAMPMSKTALCPQWLP